MKRRWPVRKPLAERLWEKVERQPNGCWEYQGFRNGKGYGLIQQERRTGVMGARRLAWMLHNQADPGELLICHKCDNPPCCNPWHLYAGTASDNQRDRTNWRSGDGANRTKITDAQILEARARYRKRAPVGSGHSSKELAEEYGLEVAYFVRLMRGQAPRRVAS